MQKIEVRPHLRLFLDEVRVFLLFLGLGGVGHERVLPDRNDVADVDGDYALGLLGEDPVDQGSLGPKDVLQVLQGGHGSGRVARPDSTAAGRLDEGHGRRGLVVVWKRECSPDSEQVLINCNETKTSKSFEGDSKDEFAVLGSISLMSTPSTYSDN